MNYSWLLETSIGTCTLTWGEEGLRGLALPGAYPTQSGEKFPGAVVKDPPPEVRVAGNRVRSHLDGKPDAMLDVPLDLSGVTDFRRAVYQAVRAVGPGETVTYGELADRMGNPGAARAVGGALGANPVALIIPCHRVLGSNGKLCGFTAPGGVGLKETLLELEGVSDPHGFLASRDDRLAELIDRIGPIDPTPKSMSTYQSIIKSIIYQQLSGNVARVILDRLVQTVGEITPETIHGVDSEIIRSAGISRAKTAAILEVTDQVVTGEMNLDELQFLTDDQVRGRLCQVKGIGPWTANMVLIFNLGRPDVLPVRDYAIRKAAQRLFGLSDLPEAHTLENLTKMWKPQRSLASRYLWRSLG